MRTKLILSPVATALAVFALARPGAASAQTLPTPVPRFYVGLGAAYGSYLTQPKGVFPTFTAGVQLTRRLSLQASIGYARSSDYYELTSFYAPTTPGGILYSGTYVSKGEYRLLAVPVLARYSLLRRPQQRLQVAVLAGATLARTRYERHSATLNYTGPDAPAPFDNAWSGTALFASAGLSASYRVVAPLAVSLDATLNQGLTDSWSFGRTASWSLTPNVNLGLHFSFGGGH